MSGVTSQPPAEEDKKPGGDQSGHINLKVKGQVGTRIFSAIELLTLVFTASSLLFPYLMVLFAYLIMALCLIVSVSGRFDCCCCVLLGQDLGFSSCLIYGIFFNVRVSWLLRRTG